MADMAGLMVLQYMNNLPDNRRAEFQMSYQSQKKDRTVALVLSLFLGTFGIDRFYLGQTGLGVAKLLTCGGVGFWSIIDWFMIMGATDRKNIEVLTHLQIAYPSAPAGGHYAPPPQGHYLPPSGGGGGGYGPPPGGGGYGPPPGR